MTQTVAEALNDAAAALSKAGVDSARLDARLLLAAALDCDAGHVLTARDRVLGPPAERRFADLLARRVRREPVAHLLGRREFWSLPFRVTADTLVPRPDSETVIEAALAAFPEDDSPSRLLDLGTGSGCLLLALLSEWPDATGIGTDIVEAALTVARANAADLGLAARAEFVAGDWAAGVAGPFDLVVSNPPYIETAALDDLMPEVRDYEPRRALDGGADGLDAYRVLLPRLPGWLVPGGVAVVEFGAEQELTLRGMAGAAGLTVERCAADLAGRPRALVLRRLPA